MGLNSHPLNLSAPHLRFNQMVSREVLCLLGLKEIRSQSSVWVKQLLSEALSEDFSVALFEVC